jgi:hypothetical protein
MSEEKICHYCKSNKTDFTCDQCGLPVCEECCVKMTIHNQIDYPLCLGCDGVNEAEQYLEACKEEDYKQEQEAKKKKKADARRKAYWKPEAIEKRRLRKEERKRLKIEAERKQIEELAKIFKSTFGKIF